MRLLTILILVGSLGLGACAHTKNSKQKPISTIEAQSKVGEFSTVEGKVAQVVVRQKVCYLNFNNRFPNNDFTVVIFRKNYKKFGKFKDYEGKKLQVTGQISRFKGNVQIIVDEPGSIKIVK